MGKISAVIITRNEEKNIGRCLMSLTDIADEIIVVDSFSTDNTENICKEYGVKFVKKEFIGYDSSKNYGNSLAKYPFILSIDADEEISKALKESLRTAKADLKEDGYYVKRLTNYCGQWIYHCGWYPDTKLRLFKNAKSSWQGSIHETLELSSNKTKLLSGDLLHYSYPTIRSHSEKINHFTDMAAISSFKKKKKVTIFKLAMGPIFEFFKKYILKRGFLDGYYGFVISVMSAYYVFYKYAKLKDLWIRENALDNQA